MLCGAVSVCVFCVLCVCVCLFINYLISRMRQNEEEEEEEEEEEKEEVEEEEDQTSSEETDRKKNSGWMQKKTSLDDSLMAARTETTSRSILFSLLNYLSLNTLFFSSKTTLVSNYTFCC